MFPQCISDHLIFSAHQPRRTCTCLVLRLAVLDAQCKAIKAPPKDKSVTSDHCETEKLTLL